MNGIIAYVVGSVLMLAALALGNFIANSRADRKARTPSQKIGACVRIATYSELTPSPKVGVSVGSRNGAQSVYDYDATEQGHACATMYGKGLAHITGLPLVDERPASTRSQP
ncbi:MAG: hypothetical protein ACREXP_04010 [Steroidobacteraceae bacterium]